MIHRVSLAVLLLAALTPGLSPTLHAQTPADANEGARLFPDPANPDALTVSWWGRAGRTYFLQQSDDLSLWTYLPVLEPGADQVIQWNVASSAPRSFLRLRLSDIPADDPFTADFDFDGVSNWDELLQGSDPLSAALDPTSGLPLDWEKFYGVPAGTNPNALAPRGDGLTYLQAFQGRFNPNDIYNGITPTLVIVDGNNQIGASNNFVSRPLILRVTDAAGHLLTNLPVSFTVSQGGGTLQRSSSASPATLLTLTTDSSGLVKTFFKLPAVANVTSQITALAGSGSHLAQVTFTESSDGGSGNGGGTYASPFDPSNVVATLNADGSADVFWTSNADPGDQTPIPIRSRDQDGNWVVIATAPAGSSSYHLPPQ